MGAAIPLHQARRALRSVFAKRSESVFGMVEGNASTSPFFVGIRPIFMIKYSGMEDYSGKKILILGLAREGIDSLRYFWKISHRPNCRRGPCRGRQAEFGRG